MSLFQRLNARWKSWHLTRDVKAGRVLRGRQPGEAVTEPIPVIEMRVFRAATQTWEDVS